MANPTTAPAIKGIGWSNGMAAQVSLPNILLPPPFGRAWISLWDWTRTGRQHLCDNLPEQIGLDVAIGERRHVQTLLGKLFIALPGQQRTAAARRVHPRREAVRRQSIHVEMHRREAVAAIMAGEPRK